MGTEQMNLVFVVCQEVLDGIMVDLATLVVMDIGGVQLRTILIQLGCDY